VTRRHAIILTGIAAALAVSLYNVRFTVRGVSVDGNDSGGRVTRPLWNAPHRGDVVTFLRHTGMTDMVEVETVTPDVGHSAALFAGLAIVVCIAAAFAPRKVASGTDP
jgi:hypothetical protein